jgi:hypothetical protein
MSLTFDLISDLYLEPEDKFLWEDKVTSLFCVIAGNISSDLKTLHRTLSYISSFYQGTFYIEGALEHTSLPHKTEKTSKIAKICSQINNLVYLHDNVAIVNGVGILGANGWYGNYSKNLGTFDNIRANSFRQEDLIYLNDSVKRMQLHVEAKKILMITSSPPNKELFFKEDDHVSDNMSPDLCLMSDTEKKIDTWAFGGTNKKVDTTSNDVNFISNPYTKTEPYWAKRIEVKF